MLGAVKALFSGVKLVITTTSGVLSEIVTAEMMGGVLDEVVSVLPVTIPVMVGFIGLRKGISFLQHVLHSA